jgi:hypothetical protein
MRGILNGFRQCKQARDHQLHTSVGKALRACRKRAFVLFADDREGHSLRLFSCEEHPS